MLLAKHNPFTVERVLAIRYELAEGDWDALLARLREHRNRGALVGAQGAGKTTLLEDLAVRLRDLGWQAELWRLNHQQRSLSPDFLGRAMERHT